MNISSGHCSEKNVDSPHKAESTHRNRKHLADMPDRKWSFVCIILDAKKRVDAREESPVSLSTCGYGNWRLRVVVSKRQQHCSFRSESGFGPLSGCLDNKCLSTSIQHTSKYQTNQAFMLKEHLWVTCSALHLFPCK